MVDDVSTEEGLKVILRKSGKSCVKVSGKSDCLDGRVELDGLLSEDEYKGFWVQTKLTSEGHMEVTRN